MKGADMPWSKDPAIKLFGRKISVPDSQIPAKGSCSAIRKVGCENSNEDNCSEADRSTDLGQGKEENQTSMQESEVQVTSKSKENKVENNGTDQEKVFKKPDKVIPCPRCNSLDTKFCYFNNYNVNQPRHFCKNCQRYWTAGGTMRNVPIGAGRRKNKQLASQYRQILVSSDGTPLTRIENSESASHQLVSSVESVTALRTPTGNGMVLKFGPEAPLCESLENVLNIGDQKMHAEMSSVNCQDDGEEPSSCESSMTASIVRESNLPDSGNQKERGDLPGSSDEPSVPHPMNCYPAPPWVFPWSTGWNNVAASQYNSGQACIAQSNNSNQVQWCPTPMMAIPGYCPPNIPLQFIPAPYWGCMPVWPAGTGNTQLSGSNGCPSPSSSNSTSCCSGNGSPTLGKHSRDSNFVNEEKAEKCILVPKTLRVDDPTESSKSPLWTTLGIKPDQKNFTSKGTIFNSFESKPDGKVHVSEATNILEANPAALSRSHTFQESS